MDIIGALGFLSEVLLRAATPLLLFLILVTLVRVEELLQGLLVGMQIVVKHVAVPPATPKSTIHVPGRKH